MSRKRAKPRPVLQKRRAARLAAVQALYQAENGEQPIQAVISEFNAHRLDAILATLEEPRPQSPEVDREWFAIVAAGAFERRSELDEVLSSCLNKGWTLARCGYLLRACLRAGAFELLERTDVPVKSVINEYVELAQLFLSADEAGFVNAVLDKASAQLRSSEQVL